MSVLDLCRNVRSQWVAFSRMVWPEDSRQLTQAMLDELTDDLSRRYDRLLALRRRIEAARERHPEPAARLARLEDAYARRRQAFARRKRLHKALLSGRVVACPDADPT